MAKAIEGAKTLESSTEESSGVEGAECWESWHVNWRDPTRPTDDINGNLTYKQRPCEMERDAWVGSRRGS